MNKLPFAVALLLVGVSPLALAGDESAFTLDLHVDGVNAYHVKCQYGKLSNCGHASLWEGTNGVAGLQTVITQGEDGSAVPRDSVVLP